MCLKMKELIIYHRNLQQEVPFKVSLDKLSESELDRCGLGILSQIKSSLKLCDNRGLGSSSQQGGLYGKIFWRTAA